MKLRTPALAATLTLLPSLVLAQSSDVQSEKKFLSAWPENVTSSMTFHRAVSGRFSTDPFNDEVVLRTLSGTKSALYRYDSERFNIHELLLDGVNDLDVYPGGGLGGRDAVVLVHSSGLKLYRMTTSGGNEVWEAASTLAGDWAGATRVWVGKDAVGATTIHGLAASGDKILRATWNGTALSAGSLALTVPTGVTGFEVANYDGADSSGNPRELFVWYGTTLLMYSWTGSFMGYLTIGASSASGNTIVTSHGPSGQTAATDRDLVVVLHTDALSAEPSLFAFNSGVSHYLNLPAVNPSCLAVVDYDGDGYEDLLIGNATGSEITLVHRRPGGAPLFELSTTLHHRMPLVSGTDRPAGKVDCISAFDFDRDGDRDVVAYQGSTSYSTSLGTRFGLAQVFLSNVATPARVSLKLLPDGFTNDGTTASASYQVILPGTLPSVDPGNSLHLHFEGWAHPSGLASNVISTRVVDDLKFLPLPDGEATITWNSTGMSTSDQVLHVYTTLVEVNSSGNAIRYFPCSLTYQTTVDYENEVIVLTELENAGAVGVGSGGSGGGTVTGGSGSGGYSSPPPSPTGRP